MNLEFFLLLNFLVLIGFVGLFYYGKRGSSSSSSLNLNLPENLKSSHGHENILITTASNETLAEIQSPKIKEVNPMFIYNGHTWDAYEVLGIVPGSSIEVIKEAFDLAIQKSDLKSHEFYKSALTAILSNLKKQGFKITS